MSFGGTIALGALIVAALVLAPRGIADVDDYHQLPLLLVPVFGFWGFVLFCAALGIACSWSTAARRRSARSTGSWPSCAKASCRASPSSRSGRRRAGFGPPPGGSPPPLPPPPAG